MSPTTTSRMLLMLVFGNVVLVGVTGSGLIGPARSSIQEDFSLGVATYGAGLAGLSAAGAITVLLLNRILRRLGVYDVVVLGLISIAGGLALVALTRHTTVLAVGCFITAAGTCMSGHVNTLARRAWQRDPRRGINLLHAINASGKVLGPALTAITLTAVCGWRGSAQVMAIGCLLLALVYLIARQRCRSFADAAMAQTTPGNRISPGRLAQAILPFLLIAGGEAAVATLLPWYASDIAGLSAATGSWLLAVHLLGLLTGRLVAAACPTGMGHRHIITTCVLCGLAVVPLLGNLPCWTWWPAVFILGGQFSATWATFYDQAAGLVPTRPDLMAYGSGLASVVGVALCILASSALAAVDARLALAFGPVLLTTFWWWYRFGPVGGDPRVVISVPEEPS